MTASKIIYTHTDEAPLLATYSLLPVLSAYAATAGVCLLQLSLAAGAPWAHLTMGGQWPGVLPLTERVVALVNAALLVRLAVVGCTVAECAWLVDMGNRGVPVRVSGCACHHPLSRQAGVVVAGNLCDVGLRVGGGAIMSDQIPSKEFANFFEKIWAAWSSIPG